MVTPRGIGRPVRQIGMAMTVAAGLAVSADATSARAEPIRIGALYPLTGNLSVLGTEAIAGAEIAVEMINENGGVNGEQVELVVADATNPANATNEARRLLTREDVKLLGGTFGSSIALAIAAVADQFGVPYWEGAAVSDELTARGYENVFRLNDNASDMSAGLVTAVTDLFQPKIGKELGELKIAMIHEDSAFGTSIAENFVEQIEAAGGTVEIVQNYAASTQDLSPLVLRLKEADPDVVAATQYFNDAILFWRQARDQDYNPEYFVAIGSGQSSPDYRKGVGDDAEGVLMSDVPASGVNPEALTAEARERQAEFIKRYEEKMGEPPASHATRNFSAWYTLLDKVLPAAGSLEPEAIREAVMALDEPEGSTILGFGLKFDENGQNERAFNVLLQWQDGRIVTVYPEKFATAEPIMIPLPDWSERDAQ